MEDALRALPEGVERLIDLRPERFDWPLFLLASVFLSVPVLELVWRLRATAGTKRGQDQYCSARQLQSG
jgi:hypothetical protein